jgi:CelD/BcsL family acetyltransferase involved in cellulose biosynthesis
VGLAVARSALSVLSTDDARWLPFLASQPEATVFHHPAWSDLLEDAYGHRTQLLVETNGDDIIAGMPLTEIQGAFSERRFVSVPFTDHCPPIATTPSTLAQLTLDLLDWKEAVGVRQLTVHGALSPTPGVHLATRAVHHQLSLGDSRRVFESLSGPVRSAIRKAEKQGVEACISRSPADLGTFYKLHTQTRRRLGLPVQPRRFFEAMWKHVVVPGLGFVVLAYCSGQPIAAGLYLAWNKNLIYKFGASDDRYWGLRPNNLVMWTAIDWACRQGYRQLDFGRTEVDNHGLREFKRRWGSIELPLIYSSIGPVSSASIPRAPMWAVGKVIRSSPAIVCRAVGELVYGRMLGSVA